MEKPLSLDEQIRRAKKEVSSWDSDKRSMMRLQGADNFSGKNRDSKGFESKSSGAMMARAK